MKEKMLFAENGVKPYDSIIMEHISENRNREKSALTLIYTVLNENKSSNFVVPFYLILTRQVIDNLSK